LLSLLPFLVSATCRGEVGGKVTIMVDGCELMRKAEKYFFVSLFSLVTAVTVQLK